MENFIDLEVLKQISITVTGIAAAWAVYYKVNFEKKKYFDEKLSEQEERLKKHVSKAVDKANIATTIINVKDKNEKVKAHLSALMSLLKCDQVWLGLFHNGQYVTGGEHLVKLTSLYELPEGGFTTREGLRVSTNALIDNVPLLHMGEWIAKNLEDDWHIQSVEDVLSPLLKESFLEWELLQGLNVILYGDEEQNQPIAVLGFNWILTEYDVIKSLNVKNSREAIKKIRRMSDSLTYILKN